jgi:hypothetical protein
VIPEIEVGDIVWYWEGNTAYASIVTRVWNDTTVNLQIFDPGTHEFLGERGVKVSIPLVGFGGNLYGGWTPKGTRKS